jgi:hypothetical protein
MRTSDSHSSVPERCRQANYKRAAEAFEINVAAVETDQRKREELTDVGLKAALVSLGDAFLVEVQRADGWRG